MYFGSYQKQMSKNSRLSVVAHTVALCSKAEAAGCETVAHPGLCGKPI